MTELRQAAFFLFVAVITVCAQLAMKRGVKGISIDSLQGLLSFDLWLRPWLIASLMLYALGATLYIALLSRTEVGRLYPAFLGLCITLMFFGSAYFGLERITVPKTLGVLSIGLGIFLLHWRS